MSQSRLERGYEYVYAVVSRRSAGLSVGVNLNPNNACNFRCVYCEVPGLNFGKAPPIDLAKLQTELSSFLHAIVDQGLLDDQIEQRWRRLNDVALSGNGEPTMSPQFVEAVQCIRNVLKERELLGRIQVILITNGSLVHVPAAQEGIRLLATMNGVLWFKVDSATAEGQKHVNSYQAGPEKTFANLKIAASLCPTWIQTCMLAWNGAPPTNHEIDAYLAFVQRAIDEKIPLRGVHLYTIARPSYQPEAKELSPLSFEWLDALADQIRAAGLRVQVSP